VKSSRNDEVEVMIDDVAIAIAIEGSHR
jgi:hypothetical protein